MFDCPHCGEPGISGLRKLALGPAVPATCQACGEKVGVPYFESFAAMVPLFLAIPVYLFSPSLTITLAVMPILFVISGFAYWHWVPLEPR